MTNDRHDAAYTKSLIMAFGYMRHEGIVFAGPVCTRCRVAQQDKCVRIKQVAPADSYSLFTGFKLYCGNIN